MPRNKQAYFQGGGGVNEPTPGKKKYKSEPAIVMQSRFKEPFYRNYDVYEIPGFEHIGPGAGWHHMEKYKSVQEFLEAKRKKLKGKYVAEDSWQLDDGTRTKKNPNIQARADLFSEIIKVAGKTEDLQVKYPELNVKEIAQDDPSPTKKYLEWMIKQIKNGESETEIKRAISFFDNNINRFPNKDINSFKHLDTLMVTISLMTDKSRRQHINAIKHDKEISSGAPVIYQDEHSKVVKPENTWQSQSEGRDTRWCTAQSNYSSNPFISYMAGNTLVYYVTNKNIDPASRFHKIAIVIFRDPSSNKVKNIEIRDKDDALVNDFELEKDMPNFDQVYTVVKQDANNRPRPLYSKYKHRSEAFSQEGVEDLSDDEYALLLKSEPNIRIEMASDHRLSTRILTTLLNDPNEKVREQLTTNHKICSSFEHDDDGAFRIALALAKDKSPNVRGNLAEYYRHIPKEMISLFLKDESSVRARLARNFFLPKEVLSMLEKDPDKNVADAAKAAAQFRSKYSGTKIFSRIIKEAGPNYDLGKGLYQEMSDGKIDSVEEFREEGHHGPGAIMDVNDIDFPIDDQVNRQDQMIYPEEDEYQIRREKGDRYDFPSEGSPLDPGELNISMTTPQIAGEHSYLPNDDFDGKPNSALNFNTDYTDETLPGRPSALDTASDDDNETDLDQLESKYLGSTETGLFGLPDGVDPEGHDSDQTQQVEQPYGGISDISNEMYEDKWNI